MVELTFLISRVDCVHNGNDHSEYTYLPTAYSFIPSCEILDPPPDKCEEGLSIHKEGDCWGYLPMLLLKLLSGAEVSFTKSHIT